MQRASDRSWARGHEWRCNVPSRRALGLPVSDEPAQDQPAEHRDDDRRDDDQRLAFPDVPRLELDQLLDQLMARAQEVRGAQGRLRGLLRASQAIAADLGLESVLRRIVEEARELVGAQYAALGVLAPEGGLSEFVNVGMAPETIREIGHLPQ